MSNGPVSGNGIAITLPWGKTVFWSVTAQASWGQYVRLVDSHQSPVFSASGASTGGHSPTQIGAGSFMAPDSSGSYFLYVGTNQGLAWSNVVWDQIDLMANGTLTSRNFVFISEDGADQDYNDSYVSISWFNQRG